MKRYAALAIVALAPALALGGEKITYNKDVAAIFDRHCVSCHRPGEIAPMSLTDYDSARPWAKSIRKQVANRIMPPWHADSSKKKYLEDRSLTEAQIATIVGWVDQGTLKGADADRPAPPVFHDTWAMGEPDFVFHAKRDFAVPAVGDEIPYQMITFETDIKKDLYIAQWEIRPSQRAAVHHANLVRAPESMDEWGAGGTIGRAVFAGGDYIGSYLPGSRPMKYPEGMALKIPAGSSLGIQVHYIGTGEEIADHIRFGVKFAQGRIDKVVRVIGTDNNDIDIPPNDGNWEIVAEVNFLFDTTVLSSGAHMHVRGKDYLMEAILPGGASKLITSAPNYDFNWQSNYWLAEPMFVPKGSTLRVTAHWDNSPGNPNNPDPAARVRYGPWTNDEMLTTWAHVVLPDEKLGLRIEDGRLVGRFADAQQKKQPFLLQTLPQTMQRAEPKKVSEATR